SLVNAPDYFNPEPRTGLEGSARGFPRRDKINPADGISGVRDMSAGKSLYERLGGVYAIAAVVDAFVERVMADPRLNANPLVDEAHHKVPKAGFKYLVTEQVCWAAGGPQRYTG